MSYDLKRDLVRNEASDVGYELPEDFTAFVRYEEDGEIVEKELGIGQDWSSNWTDLGLVQVSTDLPDGSELHITYLTGAGVINVEQFTMYEVKDVSH